jgi:hypothetical protein
MQSSAVASEPSTTQSSRAAKGRTIISGLFLLALAAFYVAFIDPIATSSAVTGPYRFSFSFEADVYLIFFVLYAIHFFYSLARPPKQAYHEARHIDADRILGMVLRAAFLLAIGGSYLTGAMISTPGIFGFATFITGPDTVGFAANLHLTFALSLIVLGLALVAYEIVRILRHKQTVRELFLDHRYPWIKVLYWAVFIGVIVQGVLGLFLAGTFTPLGPYVLIGANGYSFESLVRHLHGPAAAVLISLFYGHIYFRLRPEFHIR